MELAMSDQLLERVWRKIQEHVCSVCLDRHDDGTCGLGRRNCALAVHLPRAIEVASAIDSPQMGPYYEAFEREICARCSSQNLDGACRLRARAECALHAYLPLVVDAIREVTSPEGGE
ncbi:MAG TPA: hypothetical protein VFM88_00665 [Vicinamibacteria bacterium]|nr:hypothetical protein [Vicinamibacteria bacterium]